MQEDLRTWFFIFSIPDCSVIPFASIFNKDRISSEIDQYNSINRLITESINLRYFDITPVSRIEAKNQQLLTSDDLHPYVKIYIIWVDLMVEEILKMS